MKDLAFGYDAVNGGYDLLLSAGVADLTFVTLTAEIDQRIRATLRTFLGEWACDMQQGVPYYQRILGIKDVTSGQIADAIGTTLRKWIPEIIRIDALAVVLNPTTRKVAITFRAITTDGTAIPVGETV
jgi:hypothetical protein